jgi:DNA-directed RNA polymerase subunit RPC12/RpoP
MSSFRECEECGKVYFSTSPYYVNRCKHCVEKRFFKNRAQKLRSLELYFQGVDMKG